jgi:predicted aspartyl protease
MIAAVIAMAASPAFSASPTPSEGSKCVLEKVGDIAVEGNQLRPILVAQINGHAARLIVDTGSDATMLFPQSLSRLGLQSVVMPGAKMYGVGGGRLASSAYVKTFDVGGLVARDVDLLVTGAQSGLDADGLIGAQFLLQMDAEFDLAHKRLSFFRARGCHGDQVVYWGEAYAALPLIPAPGKALRVEIKINGVAVRAELDTGSPRSTLIPALAERAGLRMTSEEVKPVGLIGGVGPHLVAESRGRFSTFAFGEEVIRNADLEIADMFHYDKETVIGSNVPRSAVDMADMLLGADFFHAHRIYVSQSQHRIYVTYAGGPVFETERANNNP